MELVVALREINTMRWDLELRKRGSYAEEGTKMPYPQKIGVNIRRSRQIG